MKSTRALLSVLALIVATTALARADVLDTPVPTPAWTKTFGTLRVEKYGSGQPALVLVPGLTCGSWVWHDFIAREAAKHTIYAVTLPGLGDLAPVVGTDLLDQADANLLKLIADEKIDKPVVIGHSLGGYLVLRFGTEHSDLVRAVVSVDGTPVYPALQRSSADERAAAADKTYHSIADATRAQFDATLATTNADYVVDPALAKRVVALEAQSDQKATAEYIKELLTADLRPDLPKLTAPTAEIFPVPAPPLPSYLPKQFDGMNDDQRDEALQYFYNSLLTGTPNLKLLPVAGARHFVMLDKPDAFQATVDAFVAGLP